MRLSVAVAVACLSVVGFSAAGEVKAAIRKNTSIPAQGLGPALQLLAKDRGFQIVYISDEVNSLRTQGASGELSPEEALAQLLDGTGMTYDVFGENSFGIVSIAAAGTSSTSPSATVAEEKGGEKRSFWDRFRLAQVDQGQASGVGSVETSGVAAESRGATRIEEIVVTATKRAETIRDVPVAVSAISSEDILARGLTQYSDYLNSLPGVYFQDAGPGQSQIRIRGVVANEAGGGTASVATYFGETVTSVLTISGGKPNLRLVDVDRVEVLRGPQGTLFGANSLAGVVRIVPTAPNLTDFQVDLGTRGFTTAHSEDGSYHVEGVLNVPLIQDRLALRLVAYKDDIAGYIDNVVPAQGPIDYSFLADAFGGQPPGTTPAGTLVIPGNPAFSRRDINSEDTWGARAALSWQVNDRLRLDLTQVVQDVTLNSQPHVDPTAGEYAQRRPMDLVAEASNAERVNISTLVANYDWDGVSLVSASSYTNLKSIFRDDSSSFVQASFGVPIPWEDRTNSEGQVFTQEVRLQSRGEGPWQWLAGLFYLDQKADFSQTVADYSCPTCLPTLFFGQDFALRMVGDPRFVNQEQRSVFGEVSYEFSERWTLGLGGRYLEEDLERLSAAAEGFFVGGFLPAEAPRKGTSYEVNPSAYLRFRATQDATFYVQTARGFRSPQTNSALSYTGTCAAEAAAVGLGPLTDPDTLWNYELGMKSRFADGRLGVNTAIYRQEWEGVQLPVQFACGTGGVINGGDVRGQGVELELDARLTDAWQLNLSANYGRNEFEKVKPDIGFEVGDQLPGSPETNGSAGLQYDFAVNADWSGFARADYMYVGSTRYQFGQIDPQVVTLDSYNIANLRLGLQRDHLSVELFGRNITDERAVVNTVDPSQGNRQYLARPREIGVELRYSFAGGAN